MDFHESPVRTCTLATVFLSSIFFGFSPTSYAQSSEITALASETAAAISRNTRYLKGSAKVLVVDFSNAEGSQSSLGEKLADAFEAALKKNAYAFTVIDRAEHRQKSQDSRPPEQRYDEDEKAGCYASEFGANVTVEGNFRTLQGNVITLWIEALEDQKGIFEKRIKLSLPPEMLGLPPKLEPPAAPGELQGALAWVRTDGSRDKNVHPVRITKSGDQGYKLPNCLYCPNPQFSDEATKGKVQGTAILDVEIDAEGLPAAIAVVKGLPCGLAQKAVEAVEGWRFAPATGPDGNAAVVIVPIEVTFRLY
jgi:TonB family protein